MADLEFDLSPTQSRFVHDAAHIVMLMGPMGEGKTFAGVAGLIAHALRCGRDIRGALVRDTHQNIKISTVPDIQEVLGNFVSFKDDYKKMIIHSTPKVEMDLFGIDDQASISKLQGPQYAVIWLEEPAPIKEKANAGLPKEVFDLAVARASRQRGTTPRVQITQNPADEDHWTEEVAMLPEVYQTDPDTGLSIIKHVYKIPYRDNKYANPLMRVANRAAFQHDKGMYARYVEGRPAPVQLGKAVTPQYNEMVHFMRDVELPVIPGAVGIRGYDAWHNPVCGIGQFVPPGRLIFHDVLVGEGIGIEELLEQMVIPMLNSPKYKGANGEPLISDWRDIGDPTMRTPDQSSVKRSTAKTLKAVLEKAGFPRVKFEPGPTRIKNRIEPLQEGLTRLVNGEPAILLSRSAYLLHRALNGGWHWKTDNSGNIIGSVPAKDRFSHPGDMAAYVAAGLFSPGNVKKAKVNRNAMRAAQAKRAMSYGHSSGLKTSKSPYGI
ncbi:hypothetical protein [Desulfatibacillum aliphaticivorans]|uniref:hypothetical protein n=1 Tax=Desulfatibacillum aliphaticivorans TaxID=218208 RepID=UPI00048A0AE4|nr:hypothetical protein [Desulfatibacillum aliphaticivorans]